MKHNLKKILIIAVATVVISITMTLLLALGMEFILSFWDSKAKSFVFSILAGYGGRDHFLGKLIITTTVLVWVSLTVYMCQD